MFITLSKMTGFKSISGKVKVYDEKGFPFYFFDFTGKTFKTFNLPKGKFYVEGLIEELKKPIEYKYKKLPKPEYIGRKSPKNFKLIVKTNPNKCSIDFFKKIIIIDPSYLNKPRLLIDYILAHEHGHQYYEKQHLADHYAKIYLLKHGYNPSQLIFAPHFALSNKCIRRKQYLLKV